MSHFEIQKSTYIQYERQAIFEMSRINRHLDTYENWLRWIQWKSEFQNIYMMKLSCQSKLPYSPFCPCPVRIICKLNPSHQIPNVPYVMNIWILTVVDCLPVSYLLTFLEPTHITTLYFSSATQLAQAKTRYHFVSHNISNRFVWIVLCLNIFARCMFCDRKCIGAST